MKRLILLFSFCLIAGVASAQTDTLRTEVHDVLCLLKGGEIKGTILSFDEIGGGIVFRDLNGKVYSLAREEYRYFIEDKEFEVKQKGPKVLHPRKESGLAIQVGLSAAYLDLSHDFTPDDYYLNAVQSQADMPVALKVVAGSYLNRANFIGLTAEYALLSGNSPSWQAGLRYLHQYDGYKTNLGLYIPLELAYQHQVVTANFALNDTIFDGTGGYSFPDNRDLTASMNAVSISAGHGFAFMLANEKSVSLELTIVAHLLLSQQFEDLPREAPDSRFITRGAKLAVVFGL